MTAAALAFCASLGVQCHTMNDLIDAVQTHRPAKVVWLRERLVFPPAERVPKDCPARLVFLGSEPYDMWLCVREDGAPVS